MVFLQIWSQVTGTISKQEFGLIARPLSLYFKPLKQYTESIVSGNAGVLQNSNALDQETRSLLFQSDIKMHDLIDSPSGESYVFMTSFERLKKLLFSWNGNYE